ncbi:eukaryotic translation initiation factor 4E-binding protein Mextli isoform X2 [Leptopilina heterotoma]|uniref:eukaryotic translation initiation factor 4E-binding protein Mextli isoform X2 n=1 Tax=Leptopilina heterotoma TaxID=63436 RepID=UPI001CA7D262|nr:eukaryotic translation initiation factor 4E-binding protein Mextli isoform X2 [Leptopilina heterotoma]
MATTQMRARSVKKLEKPRPLKLAQRQSTVDGRISTIEDILSLIDNVIMQLSNGYHDRMLQTKVITMCNHLKLYSSQLETMYKDQLDRAFVVIRNASHDGRLDVTTRVHLLELIELRAKQWHHSDSMDAYYTQKLTHLDNHHHNEARSPENPTLMMMPLASPSTPVLRPGEVIKNSGKFAKPTRIPGKNYCKDEVIIRNSDSGKVMGIKGRRVHMIEELSETIISFQRVNPGAKERLVQITGTSEDKIHYAKDLIKNTIQRNASPVRLDQGGGEKSGIGDSSSSLNSSASDESNRLQSSRSRLAHSFSTNDASIGEYKLTVIVGNQSLKISGCDLNLVKTAKQILEDLLSGDGEQSNSGVEFFSLEEEAAFSPVNQSSPQIYSNIYSNKAQVPGRELSLESSTTSENEETYKARAISEPTKTKPKKNASRELSYDFLMMCSEGPYAKRAPADWARIQKECPNIVRKAPIRWFEPETYKAKVAAAGLVTILPAGEADNDPE